VRCAAAGTVILFFSLFLSLPLSRRWYGPGRVGREFRPRHALLTMHVWFLHKRLISDVDDRESALLVQEELFNILWDDAACRIRRAGTSELMVNKHLMQVQQYTFLHLTHYDHAYTPHFLERPSERMKELRNLLALHVVRPPPGAAGSGSDPTANPAVVPPNPDQLERLAWYVEANYQNILMDWPDECYREGRVAWVDLPDFSGMRDAVTGDVLPDAPLHEDDVLPEPWLRNVTRRGTEYYWNPVTRASSWDRPRE
jgi:cytochrome b pre-mRNA-processing protein 3